MSEKEEDNFSGLAFVACMFIGAGLGLAFGRPDVGGAIGMGVGFLSMGIIHTKKAKLTPVSISLPKSFGQIVWSVIGMLVIVCGLCLLYNPKLLYPYVLGIGIVILGILILLGGLVGWWKGE